ncbi:MAG: hypothetical protein Q7V02_01490 [Methylophilus sp.]|nr:hypothetical protein [Methylophilus sp.]
MNNENKMYNKYSKLQFIYNSQHNNNNLAQPLLIPTLHTQGECQDKVRVPGKPVPSQSQLSDKHSGTLNHGAWQNQIPCDYSKSKTNYFNQLATMLNT